MSAVAGTVSCNMQVLRGVSISEHTAPIDELFVAYQGVIPSIGVGDGGNEIGMGKIAGAISRKLSLEPCVVSTDILVVATVDLTGGLTELWLHCPDVWDKSCFRIFPGSNLT